MTSPGPGGAAGGAPRERTHVLGLIGIVLATLIAFSAFFVGFLLAPLAILLFFSLIFYSRNRSAARKGPPAGEAETTGGARGRLIAEARARQAALSVEDERLRAYEDVRPPEGHEGVHDRREGDTPMPEAVSRETD
ncbi:MAG TPA: hypothetical protein VG165_03470 [Solirubrobacteraceae bacterium]|jgi:hypothetical protein|nr:hypothetical protein [Solirubrobacteraceae bacterium]